MVSDFSKNSKISASANPGQGFQRNSERPRAAPRTSRHASKDICLGLAVSWGKTPKQCSPQPVEKIKLHLFQSKNIVTDFLLAAINGQVLSRGAARTLLLLDSVGYHSYLPFGIGGETEARKTSADPSCKGKLYHKKMVLFFLILSIS